MEGDEHVRGRQDGFARPRLGLRKSEENLQDGRMFDGFENRHLTGLDFNPFRARLVVFAGMAFARRVIQCTPPCCVAMVMMGYCMAAGRHRHQQCNHNNTVFQDQHTS